MNGIPPRDSPRNQPVSETPTSIPGTSQYVEAQSSISGIHQHPGHQPASQAASSISGIHQHPRPPTSIRGTSVPGTKQCPKHQPASESPSSIKAPSSIRSIIQCPRQRPAYTWGWRDTERDVGESVGRWGIHNPVHGDYASTTQHHHQHHHHRNNTISTTTNNCYQHQQR